MANIFTTVSSRNVGTSFTSVGGYTANSSTTATVIGLTVANVSNSVINVNVTYNDGVNDTYIVKNAPVPFGGALVPIGGDQKIILATGDSIRVSSNTASSADATMSMLQQTP